MEDLAGTVAPAWGFVEANQLPIRSQMLARQHATSTNDAKFHTEISAFTFHKLAN
jgi:hypothetical protein